MAKRLEEGMCCDIRGLMPIRNGNSRMRSISDAIYIENTTLGKKEFYVALWIDPDSEAIGTFRVRVPCEDATATKNRVSRGTIGTTALVSFKHILEDEYDISEAPIYDEKYRFWKKAVDVVKRSNHPLRREYLEELGAH